MENDYVVEKPEASRKIDDDSKFKQYCNDLVKNVPVDDLRWLIKLAFIKSAINMGKDAHDSSDNAIEAIVEFMYKDYGTIPVLYMISGFMRGSLGKYGPGRLVPNTVYKWMHEVTMEYEKTVKHQELGKENYSGSLDLKQLPAGTAIGLKIEWFNNIDGQYDIRDWDKIPLMELAESIRSGGIAVPELWGVQKMKKR